MRVMGSKTCNRTQLVMVWWSGQEGVPFIQGRLVHHSIVPFVESIAAFVEAFIAGNLMVHPNLMLELLAHKSTGTQICRHCRPCNPTRWMNDH